MEAFDKLDNPPYNVDFSVYDNWNKLATYDIQPGQDGELDMCWFLTRNIQTTNFPSGQAPFDIGWALLDAGTHTRDGKTIKGGFPGSGIGMFEPLIYRSVNASQPPFGTYPVVNHVAHEMSHYFFGSGHWADGFTFTTITSNRSKSNLKTYVGGWAGVYSGYEKWRLGWMTPTPITADGDNYTLWDLASTMTHPVKYRLYQIDIPGTSQFFLIENRRWISAFEPRYNVNAGPHGLLKPGILIYHIIQEVDDVPKVKVQKIDADGRFKWKLVHHGLNNNSQLDDYIEKDVPDSKNGYSETERIYFPGILGQYWEAQWHPDPQHPFGGGPYLTTYSEGGQFETGDDTGDSLDIYDVGDVVTPWSNSGSHYWDGDSFAATTLGVQILSFNSPSQTYKLAVRFTNPEELAPARPLNLKATNITDAILLTWEANSEPDLAGYEVYRKINNGAIQKISGSNLVATNSYVDGGVQISNNTVAKHSYYVIAVDSSNKKSTFSIPVVVNVEYVAQSGEKRGAEDTNISKIPDNFELAQNYPNPFNPTTTFAFALPRRVGVRLTIFDLNGRQVALLLNEELPAGRYEIPFDASHLASGVYLYRLSAGPSFSQTRKMMLIK